ncbi:hypothetical protein BH20ACI2_BH20ACI2_07690 [soil metagenome]
MKRCPECRRDYYDETLLYCLDDGNALLEGPASGSGASDEPPTAILHETASPAEAATRAQIHTTEQTMVLPSATGDIPRSTSFDKRLLLAPLMLAVIILGGFFGYRYFDSAHSGRINSIAVLPFANASGDKETDFLADGIAETLINNFTKIPELKVTGRATAFRFRGREGEPLEIGRELKVGSMLTGRLMQRADQLSVQVDLISTSDGSQIWGNRYEGKTSDIVSIQQRIATDVSSQLKLKLTGAQEQQIAKTYTQNPEAYQRYLRGRFYWNKRTAEALQKAIEEFQAASDADPLYALAYVGLGDSYLLLPEYAGTPVNEAMPKAKAFAEKGLQIDPSLGEAYATLGLINHYMWQFDEADREFQRAIAFNPNYPTVHHWYSNNLRERGDFKQALAEIRRAHELDPLSPIININVGLMMALNGDIQGARGQFRRTVEMDPSWFNGHFHMGLIDVIDGQIAESIPHFQKSVELAPSALRPVGMLGFSLAVVGRRAEAIELLKRLEARHAQGVSAASNIATIFIGLGEKEKAYKWLEKGFLDKDIEISRSHWYPQFNSIRDEPRFKEIMEKVRKPKTP